MSVVLLERPVPGVALLRLNRPDPLNALDMAVRESLVFATADRTEGMRAFPERRKPEFKGR